MKDLLQPGTIDPSTRLVLTNAIYFNASWHWRFNKRQTKVAPFHLEGGGSVDVPMMTETSKDFYGYAKGDGYQAVDVPYSWGEMSMTVLLPDEGALGDLENSLNADRSTGLWMTSRLITSRSRCRSSSSSRSSD